MHNRKHCEEDYSDTSKDLLKMYLILNRGFLLVWIFDLLDRLPIAVSGEVLFAFIVPLLSLLIIAVWVKWGPGNEDKMAKKSSKVYNPAIGVRGLLRAKLGAKEKQELLELEEQIILERVKRAKITREEGKISQNTLSSLQKLSNHAIAGIKEYMGVNDRRRSLKKEPPSLPQVPSMSMTAPQAPSMSTTAPQAPSMSTTAPPPPSMSTTPPPPPSMSTTPPPPPSMSTTPPPPPSMSTTPPPPPSMSTAAPPPPSMSTTPPPPPSMSPPPPPSMSTTPPPPPSMSTTPPPPPSMSTTPPPPPSMSTTPPPPPSMSTTAPPQAPMSMTAPPPPSMPTTAPPQASPMTTPPPQAPLVANIQGGMENIIGGESDTDSGKSKSIEELRTRMLKELAKIKDDE